MRDPSVCKEVQEFSGGTASRPACVVLCWGGAGRIHAAWDILGVACDRTWGSSACQGSVL